MLTPGRKTNRHERHSAAWGKRKVLLSLLAVLIVAKFALAQANGNSRGSAVSSKLAADVAAFAQRTEPGQKVNLIVQYRQQPRAAAMARLQSNSAHVTQNLNLINAVAATMPASSLASLAKDPDVVHVSLDHQVSQTSTNTDFYDQAVNAPYAWSSGLDGSGVGVAVIDSGITDQGDFSGANGSRVVYSTNLNFDGINNAFGHGTHVSGILAGNGTNSSGNGYFKTFKGIAPNANLLSFRVLDGLGISTDSVVIAGIQQAISLKSAYNIRVINLSLGRGIWESYTVDPLCQAVEAAWNAGIVVVVAAGNSGRDNSMGTNGYATIGAPGNDPYVLTVGATRTLDTTTRVDDVVTSFSSKGPTLGDHIVKPDLVAPGNCIGSLRVAGSTLDTVYPQFRQGSANGGTP